MIRLIVGAGEVLAFLLLVVACGWLAVFATDRVWNWAVQNWRR